MSILLLNADYRPLAIISQRRAVSLLAGSKAELVPDAPILKIMRSARNAFALASMIRLTYIARAPFRDPSKRQWSSDGVFERDGYKCGYCLTPLPRSKCTVDHIKPKSWCKRDGENPNSWTNTVTCCARCQSLKGDKSLHASGLTLRVRVGHPRTRYLVWRAKKHGTLREEWKHYLQV